MAENHEEKIKSISTVDGYIFQSPGEAKRAIKELEYIDKLKQTINIEDLDEAKRMYVKLTGKGYFVTPVGIHFLKELHDYLVEQGHNLDQHPIPVLARSKANGEDDGRMLRKYEVLQMKYEKNEQELAKEKSIKSKLVIAVVALVVAVFGMILMVMTNDNLGYYDAEDKVLNKYSAWEEELNQKEQELIEWETELQNKEQQSPEIQN